MDSSRRKTTVDDVASELRARLALSRSMLIFTPHLCGSRDPLAVLEAALPFVDVVQVRPKDAGAPALAPCSARDVYDWTLRVLDLLRAHDDRRVLLIANDRVDVACALWTRGCAGVHLGQDDCPVDVARSVLGVGPIVGVSTHDRAQVAACASVGGIDYLGFGPVHATRTKGYAVGLGARAFREASVGCRVPVFAIGGIERGNVAELGSGARVAVSAAVLGAEDPGVAARELREELGGA